MQHAKRMILVDEQLLESLKSNSWQKPIQQLINKQETKQSLSWRKPADIRSKSILNKQMKGITDDSTLSDDVRAKLYTQELCRFQRIKPSKKQVNADETAALPHVDKNNITVDDLIDLNLLIDNPKQKKTKRRKSIISYAPIRTRSYKRKASKPVVFDWVEY